MQTPDENAHVNNEGINPVNEISASENLNTNEIGRASCRERV